MDKGNEVSDHGEGIGPSLDGTQAGQRFADGMGFALCQWFLMAWHADGMHFSFRQRLLGARHADELLFSSRQRFSRPYQADTTACHLRTLRKGHRAHCGIMMKAHV